MPDGCKYRSLPLGELTALPEILRWIWGATLRQGKAGEKGKGEGKEVNGLIGRNTPEINFWLVIIIIIIIKFIADESP